MLNCLNPKQSITHEGLQQKAGLPLQICAVSLKFYFQNVNITQLQNDCERISPLLISHSKICGCSKCRRVFVHCNSCITADQGKGKVGVLWMYDGL